MRDTSNTYSLVKVTWQDILGLEGTWVDLEEAAAVTPVTVVTVGYVIVEDEQFVTLASSLEVEKSFCGSVTSIPRGCILSMLLVSDWQVSEKTVDVLAVKSDCL